MRAAERALRHDVQGIRDAENQGKGMAAKSNSTANAAHATSAFATAVRRRRERTPRRIPKPDPASPTKVVPAA
jgi:hypothetical protein